MDFKHTVLNKRFLEDDSYYRPIVSYVGFDKDMSDYFEMLSTFAGFDFLIFDFVFEMYIFLFNKYDSTHPLKYCIIKDSYSYDLSFKKENIHFELDAVPIRDVPFCDFETYEVNGVFNQGISFINKTFKQYSFINFAIYDTDYLLDESLDLFNHPRIDLLNKANDSSNIPFTILEYLRNKNTNLFEVK